MKLSFYKYQGTGNDFVMVDNRKGEITLTQEEIAKLCHRKFGIGADGFILLSQHSECDFEMVYYNADGNLGSMCGNGARCTVAFAKEVGLIGKSTTFMAYDGTHEAKINADDLVSLKMGDVKGVEINDGHYFLDTGSPHYVTFVENIVTTDVVKEGRKIRYNERFNEEGTNVNFVENKETYIEVRTYERGVEDETLSCGTGVTATAICAALRGITGEKEYCGVKTMGGNLVVKFHQVSEQLFKDIWLEGPARMVYKGEIDV